MPTRSQSTQAAPDLQTDNLVYDLADYGLICAQGDDTVTFLQGQFSNDVRNVTDTTSQLSSYNTPKGRALACFRIFRIGDKFYLRLPKEIIETTLKRLRMFVMRSKVVLDDASALLPGIGLSGHQATEWVHELVGNAPAAVDTVTHGNGLTAVRVGGPQARYEIYGEPASRTAAWATLTTRARVCDWSTWRLLDIQAGIPTVFKATAEEFVPQMINLELLNGVSFNKGCYTGQEIVARMHYLGSLKKRMYRLHVDAPTQPQPNDRIYEHDTGNDQSVGQIVDAQPTAAGGFDALAVVQKTNAENGNLRLGAVDGPQLKILPLPYAF